MIKSKFIYLSSFVAISYWFIEISFDAFIFNKGNFTERLFPLNDPNEIWMRFIVIFLILTSGFTSQWMGNKISKAYEKERELTAKLEGTIKEIKILQGILPICASCKKIRDDKGYWSQVEAYISEHTDVRFSHGFCPECMKKLYPEFAEKI